MTRATTQLRSATALRAIREDIELHTADGLTLVGELALPADRPPKATLVTLHPLPTHGGFMDSHIFRKASLRLPELADLAVLRFNTRGTSSPRGTSEGSFDEGIGEQYDVEAALRFAQERNLPRIWVVGWSFGTELTIRYARELGIEGAILLSPPLHRATEADLQRWTLPGPPLVAIIPEFDDYLRPAEARERFSKAPAATVIDVEDGTHLWVGEPRTRRILDEIVAQLGTAHTPLPTEVDDSLLALPTHENDAHRR